MSGSEPTARCDDPLRQVGSRRALWLLAPGAAAGVGALQRLAMEVGSGAVWAMGVFRLVSRASG